MYDLRSHLCFLWARSGESHKPNQLHSESVCEENCGVHRRMAGGLSLEKVPQTKPLIVLYRKSLSKLKHSKPI